MLSPVAQFLEKLVVALECDRLVRVIVTASAEGKTSRPHRIQLRPVLLRKVRHWQWVVSGDQPDHTSNLKSTEAIARLRRIMETNVTNAVDDSLSEFSSALMETAEAGWQLSRTRAGHWTLAKHPISSVGFNTRHDRVRSRIVDCSQPWLKALNVTAEDGHICAGMEAKYRQIHRFVELIAPEFAEWTLTKDQILRVVDMGCGKGYLTFALFDHLNGLWPDRVEVCGVELRKELVSESNRVAEESGCHNLKFVSGGIVDFPLGEWDALVALHACNTATDDALAYGVRAGARTLVVSPCCHQELSAQLRSAAIPSAQIVLRHGILRERMAEIVTDALRAALLEWAGYSSRVFEFVSPEHSGKNLMLTASRSISREPKLDLAPAIREFAKNFGVRAHHLAGKLGFEF